MMFSGLTSLQIETKPPAQLLPLKQMWNVFASPPNWEHLLGTHQVQGAFDSSRGYGVTAGVWSSHQMWQ
jgi:hypothetical protein